MQNDSQAKSAEPNKNLPHYVHPLVAWTAIVNFALIFSLAPAMSLTQTATAAMSEGSEAVATRLPESSKLAYARYVAMEQEGVQLGDVRDDNEKKGDETSEKSKSEKSEKKSEGRGAESSCMHSCRITKFDCTRAADSVAPQLRVCNQKYTDCLQACGVNAAAGSKDAKMLLSASLKDANEAYKAAASAAREKRASAIEKAQSDFEAEMKAAREAYKAARDALKASSASVTTPVLK